MARQKTQQEIAEEKRKAQELLTPAPFGQQKPVQTPLTQTPAPLQNLQLTPQEPTQTLFQDNRKGNAPVVGSPHINAPQTDVQNITNPQGIEISTGGKVETLRAQPNPLSAESGAMIAQQQRETQRLSDLTTAFDFAMQNPLPSTFYDPGISQEGVNRAMKDAALNSGTVGLGAVGTGAAIGLATGGPIGAAIGAGAGFVSGVVTSALRARVGEIQNQRKDSINFAVGSYNDAEKLRVDIIKAANQGADPYELIDAYREMEQIKRTSAEAAEFAARRDPSGFSDSARTLINTMKRRETQNMRYVQNQRFLRVLQNPASKTGAPEVPETAALIE